MGQLVTASFLDEFGYQEPKWASVRVRPFAMWESYPEAVFGAVCVTLGFLPLIDMGGYGTPGHRNVPSSQMGLG